MDYQKITAIGTLSAVIVALGVSFIPIIVSSVKNCRLRKFLKRQVHAYLCAINISLDKYEKKKAADKSSFEDTNKKNFDVLEMLFRSSDVMSKKDQEEFKTFVLFFKGFPNLDRGKPNTIQEFKSKIRKIVNYFAPQKR